MCKHCCTEDEATLELLLELPLSDPIIEDQKHVLLTCPLYADLRHQLLPATRELLERDIVAIFENSATIIGTLEIMLLKYLREDLRQCQTYTPNSFQFMSIFLFEFWGSIPFFESLGSFYFFGKFIRFLYIYFILFLNSSML